MREIPLTQGKVALVDDEDYERVAQFNWHAVKHREIWYAQRNLISPKTGRRTTQHMQRFILDTCTAPHIDHRDCDGLNNQRYNFRPCTHAQNFRNRGAQRNNTSGYKGVTWSAIKNRWLAAIQVDSTKMHLGNFRDPVEAARAYDAAAAQHFGEFAVLNFS